jgi:hypothetical protein
MFPTFDVPPQHAETVGARKARRAKEDDAGRRSSTATSQSSGSTHSATANSGKSRAGEKSGGFGWFGKSNKKGVQEISTLPSVKKLPPPLQEPVPDIEPFPPTAPLPPPQQDSHRRPSDRSQSDTLSLHPERFPASLDLRSLPSHPPTGALPQPPSPGLLSLPGMWCIYRCFFIFSVICRLQRGSPNVAIQVHERSTVDQRCPCT